MMTRPILLPGDRVRFTDPYEGIVAGRVIEILPPSPRLCDCIVQPDYAMPGTVWRLPMAALEREPTPA